MPLSQRYQRYRQLRHPAYSSLQKKLAEELPYISIAYRNQAVFASKNIGGEVHPVESNVFRGIEAWTYQKGE